MVRIEASVTSLSWIPSEAIQGMGRLPFEMVAHYDEPLPDRIEDLGALLAADRFRFANELRAWIEVDGGRITAHGYSGRGHIGSTTLRLGGKAARFAAVAFPDLQHPPVASAVSVRFVQTTGGRTGVPTPRPVKYPPFVQIAAPLVWTTLALTLHADGSSFHEMVGASPFPRHWIYDSKGQLSHKSGLLDAKTWSQRAFGAHTPWGDEDSPALVTEVESALERDVSARIMRGGRQPRISSLRKGQSLVNEGDPGSSVFVLLDGVLAVEVKAVVLGEFGPGAVLGERALIEGGKRTATLRAVTPCRVATVSGEDLDPQVLTELAAPRHREDASH